MKTTPLMTPCPVCNGAKTIIVTETIETEDHVTLEDCKADDKAREERTDDYCTCNYQQPHTYGGESVQHCVNCHKWIKPIQ
jgi:hypothetical protein